MSALQVVAAIIEDEQGLILIAQRPSGKILAGLWEFPGGKIEAGESASEALRRELKEELELEVSIGRFMGIFRHSYEWGDVDLHVYQVKAVNDPKRTADVSVFKWINPSHVKINELVAADVKPFQSYLDQILN